MQRFNRPRAAAEAAALAAAVTEWRREDESELSGG